jgi:hypothetical protein
MTELFDRLSAATDLFNRTMYADKLADGIRDNRLREEKRYEEEQCEPSVDPIY